MISKFSILNGAKCIFSEIFWNYLVFIPTKNALDILLVQLGLIRADISLSVHTDNKNKDIWILGEGPTQGLDDTILTAGPTYPINFTQPNKRYVLSLHYNGSNSLSFVNATKICQFKVKDSEIKDFTLCLGNISKDFIFDNTKKYRIKRNCKVFSVDSTPVDTNDILDIHKYLMKKIWYKKCLY